MSEITDTKAWKISVIINSAVSTQGDSAGCRLKDKHPIDIVYGKEIAKGAAVKVTGTCSNGMTPRGVSADCGYSIELLKPLK